MMVRIFAILLIMLTSSAQARNSSGQLVIGITLHPYYSFAANIVGDLAEVLPLIGAGLNPHGYQPQPADMQRATEMDVLIVNGIGHDQWAFEIVAAAGRTDDLPLIYANAGVALIPVAGAGDLTVVNPHTFVSINAAIQQVYEIARQLSLLDPPNAQAYVSNAQKYATKLRRLRAEYSSQISEIGTANFRAATVHAGYDYLFQEFGLRIVTVIEPRHGVQPTARQLSETVDMIKAANVNVLLAEEYFATELAETIHAETGVNVFPISHISDGAYTPERFEEEMHGNLETLIAALKSVAK